MYYGLQDPPNAMQTRRNTAALEMLDINGAAIAHQAIPLAFRPSLASTKPNVPLNSFDLTEPHILRPETTPTSSRWNLESVQVTKESNEAVYESDLAPADSATATLGPSTNSRKRKADPDPPQKSLRHQNGE
ncbi:hypothetical protein FRC01_007158, partial [Tulasnella sp. 417]